MTGEPTPEKIDLLAARMATLGKMSAALAHELNNPAAAAQRAASELHKLVWKLALLEFDGSGSATSSSPAILALLDRTSPQGHKGGSSQPDPLSQSEHEERLSAWLEEHGIAEGWKLAPDIADTGLDVEWLDALSRAAPGRNLSETVTWVASAIAATRLADEIVESTTRISELVAAVKSYSFVDRAPVQLVDVHEGLESTLVMLGHRLKGIDVVRHYDRALPTIPAHAGELNQVWTNLIDNAIDALDGKGRIEIRTLRDRDRLVVEIADNGPGIPVEDRSHIFEPFFTTKTLGTGLGLGLDICSRIVTERHHGEIHVDSEPGDTRFRVYLPIEQLNTR